MDGGIGEQIGNAADREVFAAQQLFCLGDFEVGEVFHGAGSDVVVKELTKLGFPDKKA